MAENLASFGGHGTSHERLSFILLASDLLRTQWISLRFGSKYMLISVLDLIFLWNHPSCFTVVISSLGHVRLLYWISWNSKRCYLWPTNHLSFDGNRWLTNHPRKSNFREGRLSSTSPTLYPLFFQLFSIPSLDYIVNSTRETKGALREIGSLTHIKQSQQCNQS